VDSYSAVLLKSWVNEKKFRASIITLDGAEFSAPGALTLRLPRKRGTKINLFCGISRRVLEWR